MAIFLENSVCNINFFCGCQLLKILNVLAVSRDAKPKAWMFHCALYFIFCLQKQSCFLMKCKLILVTRQLKYANAMSSVILYYVMATLLQ